MKRCYKKQNQAADTLAKEGTTSENFEGNRLFVVPPVFVWKIVWLDMIGTMYERKISMCTEPLQYGGSTLFALNLG